jgi:hypothetical protein
METRLKEEWKELKVKNIAKSEEYIISNFGRIKSLKVNEKGRLLNPSLLKGYRVVSLLMANGRRTTRYIHKLVAEHFLAKDNHLQRFVIHIDFSKENNYIENLSWASKKGLKQHQSKNPNYKRGTINNAKLSIDNVLEIKRRLRQNYFPLYKLAKEFGISHTQLNRIRKGENWKHILTE